jgi:Uma2 family endonuclease
MSSTTRYTIADLEHIPTPMDDTRYELIDGELFVSTQPRREHQYAAGQVTVALAIWSQQSGLGRVYPAPGVIFSPEDAVAPDVIWVSHARGTHGWRDDGHLHVAPELMVEILSPGSANERRDRERKLELYERTGVDEYWIVDWRARTISIYRRSERRLHLVATLTDADALTSPLLPDFAVTVRDLWDPLAPPATA